MSRSRDVLYLSSDSLPLANFEIEVSFSVRITSINLLIRNSPVRRGPLGYDYSCTQNTGRTLIDYGLLPTPYESPLDLGIMISLRVYLFVRPPVLGTLKIGSLLLISSEHFYSRLSVTCLSSK